MKRPKGPAVDLAAGIAAGLVASFVMNGFQQIWATVAGAVKRKPAGGSEQEPATVKAADKIAHALTGNAVAKRFRPLAGAAMHYGLGAAVGGAYGLASRLMPNLSAGRGLICGGALWLALDESMLPAMGLAKPWRQTSDGVHFYAFVSRLVFGLALEDTTRRIGRALS